MIRSGHFFYDLRELLSQPLLLTVIVVAAGFFIFFVSFQFIFPFALLIMFVLAARGLIGRRCPKCDRPLKEIGAERDPEDTFVIYITWRCPRDGYEEKEKVKGSGGLFGTG
jgi:hypothetical protein